MEKESKAERQAKEFSVVGNISVGLGGKLPKKMILPYGRSISNFEAMTVIYS